MHKAHLQRYFRGPLDGSSVGENYAVFVLQTDVQTERLVTPEAVGPE